MNQREFQSDMLVGLWRIEINLSPAELFCITLRSWELNRLGLDEKTLMPILLNISNLEDGELSLKDVFRMRGVNRRTAFKINSGDMIPLLRSIGKKDAHLLANQGEPIPEFVTRKLLERRGIGYDELVKMVYTPIVLSKIKLNDEELKAIGVKQKIIDMKDKKIIEITFHKYTKQLDSRRARECPMKDRCHRFFDIMKDYGYNSFSCSECLVHKVERYLDRQGHFNPIEIGSYGVAETGF